ncbi:mothers against decapentaplegic homolog 7 isoform X2 [Sceloporus undulatus]|uniref:mothers against decapentaplegic homolog 7 isoform X2 n=1 Tax=Sceloporus undulatus TaxID=8520 RepID=UPI001C4BD47A|nr:mothers against decapentaplegic homolog 7 isoform X2 [Sceloporus undulatus]
MLQLALASPPLPRGPSSFGEGAPSEALSDSSCPPPASSSSSSLCPSIISGCCWSWLPGLGPRLLHELRTACPIFSRGSSFTSRMFRTKRSVLVRRLWRSRAAGGASFSAAAAAAAGATTPGAAGAGGSPAGGAAEEEGGGGELGEGALDPRIHGGGGGGGSRGCCLGKGGKGAKLHPLGSSEAELKALTHAVLKRLKEKHLEGLLQAVESRGGARTSCLLLPSKGDAKLGQHWYSLPLLLGKVFRWPDLRPGSEVKRLVGCECYGTKSLRPDALVCCNPFHLSRLCELESPPPPYSRYPMDFLKPTDSQVLQEAGDPSHWCVVAYWEEKTRVGRLYSVQEPSLDIFYDLPQGNGFCLGQLNSDNKSQLVQKVRSKIGYGIQLTKEVDGVWVYNRSSYPIFIKSATLDNPDSRTLLVHKVFPGFSIKAFDYEKAYSLQRPNDHEFMQQPWTGFTVQISFVKGWGQCYTRQFISSCPCWLEVIFNNR